MQLTINHETTYSYEDQASYSIQSLRLTPQPFNGQYVRSWSIEANGAELLHAITDSYGNVTHTLVVDKPHKAVKIRVRGCVDTSDTSGVVRGSSEPFPPLFYLRETAQTKSNGAIRALAKTAQTGAENTLDCLHKLMSAIRDVIEYKKNETDAHTTAIEALSNGSGVCQDHAHVFISAARALEIPARYVSGYLLNTFDEEESEAAHAWAEAYVEGLGWVGFDVANKICPSEQYVRVGIGLDYQEAAPVRGVRKGGGEEEMTVTVRVQQSGGMNQ